MTVALSARASLKDVLAENALRLTAEREAILGALAGMSEAHPTADEVYMATREKHPGVGLATVYRTLDLFSRLGIVAKNDLGGASARYEMCAVPARSGGATEAHSHSHLVCVRCGSITGFDEDLLKDIEETVLARTGFFVEDHDLKFYGVCGECRRQANVK